MRLTVQKWGNSLAVRIPKAVGQQVNVRQGSQMDMSLVANKIILSSVGIARYSLAVLLKKASRKNAHTEISFGQPSGKEIW